MVVPPTQQVAATVTGADTVTVDTVVVVPVVRLVTRTPAAIDAPATLKAHRATATVRKDLLIMLLSSKALECATSVDRRLPRDM